MISPYNTYIGNLDDAAITNAAIKYGYEEYIPYNFVRDLINVWTWLVYTGDPFKAILIETEYDKTFISLLKMLNIEQIPFTDPLVWVMELLYNIKSKVNFRSLERSAMLGTKFILEEEIPQQNYKVDLEIINPEILNIVSTHIGTNLNEIILPDDVRLVLQFYNNLKKFVTAEDTLPILTRSTMKDYSQIMKVPKHRLIFPWFKYDLITKHLNVKVPTVYHFRKADLVFLIDVSYSTVKHPYYKLLYKAMLLYLYSIFEKENTITMYFFSSIPERKVILKDKQQLLTLFESGITVNVFTKGWKKSEEYFQTELKGNTVLLLTDGEEDSINFKKSMKNNLWYIVTLYENKNLRDLTRATNGKFIKV